MDDLEVPLDSTYQDHQSDPFEVVKNDLDLGVDLELVVAKVTN